jgi:Prokaryotic homologs of the JAB domain
MSGLNDVRLIRVPRRLALDAHAHLRRVGARGLEGFALWAGTRGGDSFQVSHTVIPEQRGVRSASGVCVTIGPEELHRLNVWLYENKLAVVAQLHSHPGRAYHSDTDDAFPIATAAGCLSLVIPDFASQPFALARCAVYRLSTTGRWLEVPAAEVPRLIEITD